jgi:hypothetical protein
MSYSITRSKQINTKGGTKMKHKLLVLGIIALAIVTFGTIPAEAQTVANGPYYATPSWDQILPSSTRFIVLSNFRDSAPGPGGTIIIIAGTAVLDRETGLVWETSPSTSTFNWLQAQFYCNNLAVGNRKGWRLPTIQELASLIDPSVALPGPTLPAGHPFSNVQSSFYWSATTIANNSSDAWDVLFFNGSVLTNGKSGTVFVWCVRGGQGVDPQ